MRDAAAPVSIPRPRRVLLPRVRRQATVLLEVAADAEAEGRDVRA